VHIPTPNYGPNRIRKLFCNAINSQIMKVQRRHPSPHFLVHE
jgi:hypothetical protein